MVKWNFVYGLTKCICEVGLNQRRLPMVFDVEPFEYFFDGNEVKKSELDNRDGNFTRREILARYLLLSSVLDQGPDIEGVGLLLKKVTTDLYQNEIRIFHSPLDFFKELNISIDGILKNHDSVKDIRAEEWAQIAGSSPSKYNLFFAQSPRGIISIKQILDYSIHRWGTPLCVMRLLEKDNPDSDSPLVDYLEQHDSAEIMSKELKKNERYGLGSAIGDKACHLFAKLYVSILGLVKREKTDGWGDYSYEVPFDSNAGRVLFRTGFFHQFATEKLMRKWKAVQPNQGAGGTHYIRVTEFRSGKVAELTKDDAIFSDYLKIVCDYLKTKKRPRKVEIQQIPNMLLYKLGKSDLHYTIADFDEGLIHIGTQFCSNNAKPNCKDCLLNEYCVAYNEDRNLIDNYRT